MKTTVKLLLPALFLLPLELNAQTLLIGPSVSTIGPGVNATVGSGTLSVSLTAGFDAGDLYEFSTTQEGTDFTIKPGLSGFAATVNWHPTSSGFYLGVGGLLPSYSADITSGPLSGTVTVGGQSYTANDVGTMSGSWEISGFSPMATVGFGGSGFQFQIGAALGSEPTLELSATGPIASDSQFRADLEELRQDIMSDTEPPVIPFIRIGWSFGVN